LISFLFFSALTDEDDSLARMYQCVSELPPANRETLAAISLHLQKVAMSSETQMSVPNLAKVFGPTLVGHRSPNPSHMEMLDDTKSQPIVSSSCHYKMLNSCPLTAIVKCTLRLIYYKAKFEHCSCSCISL